MKPVPARQRRQAHRQRKAPGRALHQVRALRRYVGGRGGAPNYLQVPRLVRKHAELLRRTFRGFDRKRRVRSCAVTQASWMGY
jgi:hypothetical protein